MNKNRKKIRSTLEWKQKIEEWEKTGKTIAIWCEEEGESFHSFKYWRRILSGNYNQFTSFANLEKSSFQLISSESLPNTPSEIETQIIIQTLHEFLKVLRGLSCFQ